MEKILNKVHTGAWFCAGFIWVAVAVCAVFGMEVSILTQVVAFILLAVVCFSVGALRTMFD